MDNTESQRVPSPRDPSIATLSDVGVLHASMGNIGSKLIPRGWVCYLAYYTIPGKQMFYQLKYQHK